MVSEAARGRVNRNQGKVQLEEKFDFSHSGFTYREKARAGISKNIFLLFFTLFLCIPRLEAVVAYHKFALESQRIVFSCPGRHNASYQSTK